MKETPVMILHHITVTLRLSSFLMIRFYVCLIFSHNISYFVLILSLSLPLKHIYLLAIKLGYLPSTRLEIKYAFPVKYTQHKIILLTTPPFISPWFAYNTLYFSISFVHSN